MDAEPINQGAILGQQIVPDYMAGQLRQQLAGAQVQQAQAQALSAQTAHLTQQREAARQAAFQARLGALGPNPTLADHLSLMREFPEYSEALNRSYQAQDTETKDADFRDMAQVYSALHGPRPDVALATRQLQARHDADTAAGRQDATTEQMLAALNSGDPAQIAAATEMARRTAAIMAGPERFAAIYGADEPHVSTVAPGGLAIQDNAPGGPRVIGQSPIPQVHAAPNGAFETQGPTPGVPILGFTNGAPGAPTESVQPATVAAPSPSALPTGPLPRNGQPMPAGMFQGWQVIGVPGDPRRRAGGREVPHNGVDFRPPANNPHLVADRPLEIESTQPDHGISGITAIVHFPDGARFNLMHLAVQPRPGHYGAGQVIATAGNTGNARNGSTQIHVQPWGGTQHDPRAYFGRGVGSAASPIRVTSRQQYEALPSGATYIPPDGSAPRTKP